MMQKMYCHIRDTDDIDSLQISISKFVDWTEKWQVKLNTDKCNILSYIDPSPKILKYRCGTTLCYKQYFVSLEEVVEIKDLGIYYDSLLLFDKHISEKVKKSIHDAGYY